MVLQSVLELQKEAITNYGPSNPLCGVGHVRNTIGKILEQSGFKDTTQFFKAVPLDFDPPPPEPKPTPEELLAQVEREKTMADMQIDAAKLELEKDKLLADIELRVMDINAKNDSAYTTNMVKLAIEQNKLQMKPRAEA